MRSVLYIYIYIYIYIYRGEGIARTGYLIPGRDGIPGLDLAGNSSAAVVALPALGGLRPPNPPFPVGALAPP